MKKQNACWYDTLAEGDEITIKIYGDCNDHLTKNIEAFSNPKLILIKQFKV